MKNSATWNLDLRPILPFRVPKRGRFLLWERRRPRQHLNYFGEAANSKKLPRLSALSAANHPPR